MTATAYLIVLPAQADNDDPSDRVKLNGASIEGFCWLSQQMVIVVTDLSRSKLYHAVKRQLGDDRPLLVAPLSQAPKFKGLASGSTKWVRQHM
ncbi:hypothetical protein [Roseibium marinum]|uniref:Uncharacterized protein n=1 Tax=Roseibium marinum TaxID=281252 RepID=A0A2S3UNX6_9HYPH|nr:hypothetical protein [Roseibium marinum]POF29428.1 hypothetical protein CLV41_109204 [Roseibium marinum]